MEPTLMPASTPVPHPTPQNVVQQNLPQEQHIPSTTAAILKSMTYNELAGIERMTDEEIAGVLPADIDLAEHAWFREWFSMNRKTSQEEEADVSMHQMLTGIATSAAEATEAAAGSRRTWVKGTETPPPGSGSA